MNPKIDLVVVCRGTRDEQQNMNDTRGKHEARPYNQEPTDLRLREYFPRNDADHTKRNGIFSESGRNNFNV